MTDAVFCGIDEEVRTNSPWAECCDLLDNIFPDLFFVRLLLEGFLQACLEFFGGEHLTSFGGSVFGVNLLLADRLTIRGRIA